MSFDILPRILSFFIPLIMFFVFKFIQSRFEKGLEIFGRELSDFEESIVILGKYISLGMFIILVISFSYKFYKSYEIYYSEKLIQIEGYVYDLRPMNQGGKRSEEFKLNNYFFEYSRVISDYGFNEGNLIREGQYLRISFYTKNSENIILKLETKN